MTTDTSAEPSSPSLMRGTSFRRLTRDSVIFASGSVAGKLIALILLPFLTRSLSADEFGHLDVLSTLGSAVISILTLGLDVAVARMYADRRAESHELFGSYAVLALLVSAPAALTMAIAAPFLANSLLPRTGDVGSFVAVGVITFVGGIQVVVLNVLRVLGRPMRYAILSSGALIVHAVLAIALVLLWRPVATSVLIAWALSLSFVATVGLVSARKELGRPTRQMATALLRLGGPAAPAVLFTFGADFANRAILLHNAGPVEVAYLSVALRFASVAALVVTGFQLAWQPRAYFDAQSSAGRARLPREGIFIVTCVSLVAIAIAAIAPEAVSIIAGVTYVDAVRVAGATLVGSIASSIYLVAATASVVRRRTMDLAIATAAALILSTALNAAWSTDGGAVGTAIAIVIGQVASIVVLWALSRSDMTDYRLGRMVVIGATSTCAVFTLSLLGGGLWLGFRFILAAGAGVAVAWLALVDRWPGFARSA